ncbi:MAG: S-layer homology domain-containing protein [Succiniclasticum sp.]|jgi:hypothetical protein
MKKSLVLAMAMALGVTASAYASNPFSDVPAGHWAYDSIAKLAAAGVIDGYGDTTFKGDRLMTRYEMAQIVAKAMAKGANVDKLAAEFADELDALGVRVAALEKKTDNVKIGGEIRAHYSSSNKYDREGDKKHEAGLRTRLYFTGAVNDNWSYIARLENQQWFTNNDDSAAYKGEDNDVNVNVAMAEGRLGGVNLQLGRIDDVFADGYIYDGEQDAVRASYGDKVYVAGAYGKPTDANEDEMTFEEFWQAEVGTHTGSFVDGKVGYMSFRDASRWVKDAVGEDKDNIWYAGLDFNVAKDTVLSGMYLKSNIDSLNGKDIDDDGYVVGLSYRGADPSEPGTWGLGASYYDQGRGTYLVHTIDGFTDSEYGFKGWSVNGNVTIAKNMVANVTYYDTKAKDGDDTGKHHVLWSELNISF